MIQGTWKYSIVIISFDNIYNDEVSAAPQIYIIEEKRLPEVRVVSELLNEIIKRVGTAIYKGEEMGWYAMQIRRYYSLWLLELNS